MYAFVYMKTGKGGGKVRTFFAEQPRKRGRQGTLIARVPIFWTVVHKARTKQMISKMFRVLLSGFLPQFETRGNMNLETVWFYWNSGALFPGNWTGELRRIMAENDADLTPFAHIATIRRDPGPRDLGASLRPGPKRT